MTRVQRRLAELEAIRDRSLTDEEQREVKRLAHAERQRSRVMERYRADPEYRAKRVARSVEWDRANRSRLTRAAASALRSRDECGRYAGGAA